MQKTILALAALLLAGLTGCATTQAPQTKEALLPEIDVVQVKENADEALKISRETKLDLEAVNTKLIEVDNRLLLIGEELANLSAAKLEELENQVAILAEELRTLEQENKLIKRTATVSNEDFKETFTPNPRPRTNKPVVSENEAQEYKKASDYFYSRNYPDAIMGFDKVLAAFPDGAYADNCAYWIGECHFSMGNYAKAIAAFSKVFTYAQTEKADDSQFKIALANLRMGDKRQAVAEFEKLLSLYPDSEYVGRAKAELKKLN